MSDEAKGPETEVEGTPAPKKKLKDMTPEERREDTRLRVERFRARKKAAAKAASYVFDSSADLSKADAVELLEARAVKHPHIQRIVLAELSRFAEQNQIPFNRFLIANGARQAQLSYEAGEPQQLDAKTNADVLGELLSEGELFALYDAFFAPHYPESSFEDYLKYRFRAKNDVYYLGHILGFDGFSDCHKRWAYEFFPRWDPIGLPRNYTLKQRNEWAAAQSPIKDRLLLASRRAFKSTSGRVLVAALLITCWDAKVIYISETRPLARQNIEALRGFFEVEPGIDNPYVKFQRLFPEACISKDDGSVMTYNHPCARLRLPGANVESSSMDSSTAGRRSTLILGDDIISEETSGNEDIREKQIKKWSMVTKLREKGTYVLNLATPYHEEDVYASMIENRASKKYKDPTFLHRIDAAFTVKPQAQHKLTPALVSTITLDDIDSFLMPDLPWAELQVDMRTSPRAFLSQNLCIFPRDDDEGLQVQFTHEAIWKRVRTMSEMGRTLVTAKNFMAIDRSGGSVARTADFQCGVVGRVQPIDGRNAVALVDAKLCRARDSEFIIETLVPLIRQHNPQVILFEKDRGWADFEQTLRMELLKRSIPVPWIRTLPIDNSPKAKAKRAKRLEVPLATGRLYFNANIADLEACLLQLEKFDGTPSNSVRKDDFVDSLQLLCEALLPSTFVEVSNDEEAKKKREQREQNLKEEETRRQRQEYHDRMFGGGGTPGYVSTASQWSGKSTEPAPDPAPAPQPAAPKHYPRGGSFAVLPGAFRRGRQ